MDNSTPQPQAELLEMNLDYDGGNILQETVRWSKFLSIVGMIALGIYLLAALVGGSYITALVQQAYGLEGAGLVGLVIVGVIFILVILIFVVVMLYRFSVLTRRGIETQDQATFNRGLKSLKTYFLISGIFGILYVLMIIWSTVKALI